MGFKVCKFVEGKLYTKNLLASIKTLTNSEPYAASKISIRLPVSLIGRFSQVITSNWREENLPNYTCHERFTEQFSQLQTGSEAGFTVIGGFLKAATS